MYTYIHDHIIDNLYVENDTVENAANLLYLNLHTFINSLPSPLRPLDGVIHHLRRESLISRTHIFFCRSCKWTGSETSSARSTLKCMVKSFGWMALDDKLFTLSPINVLLSIGELQTLRTQGLIVLLSLIWLTNICCVPPGWCCTVTGDTGYLPKVAG